jgi:ubiquinone/menaquinone biosynthesis C-methylase UbiE
MSKQEKPNQKQVWNNIAQEWFLFKDEKPTEHVTEFLKKQKGNILDLGSGAGRYLTKIKNGKMFLVDFSEEMLKLAKKKAEKQKIDAEFILSDLAKLPFDDNFFDAAICISALHCLETKEAREKTIKELYRVLKPKAQAEIAVWNKNSRRFKNSPKERYVGWRDKGKRYYYLFDEDEIKDSFKKAGFKIVKEIPHSLSIDFIVEKS